MAQITTYICDVSGKSSNIKEDFVEVELRTTYHSERVYPKLQTEVIKKLVMIDIAKKLYLFTPTKEEQETHPEPTFEAKLTALLTSKVEEILNDLVPDIVGDCVANELSNR